MLDAGQSSTPDETDSVLKPDIEEECSFLKIENVVSLAPKADGAESSIVSHYVSYLLDFFLICFKLQVYNSLLNAVADK